jgi:hypothetical protein
VTNYGAGYILAALPRRRSARQLSVLIALETFRCDGHGWRAVGQVKLAETANVDRATLLRARAELIDAKLIDYRAGRGKGVLSQYKILIPPLDKGSPVEPFTALSETVPDSPGQGPIRVQPRLQKGSTTSLKGFNRKRGKHAAPAGQRPDFRQNGQHAALRAKALALKAEGFSSGGDEPPPPRKLGGSSPWCGQCNEQTRDSGEDSPCPRCHPVSVVQHQSLGALLQDLGLDFNDCTKVVANAGDLGQDALQHPLARAAGSGIGQYKVAAALILKQQSETARSAVIAEAKAELGRIRNRNRP